MQEMGKQVVLVGDFNGHIAERDKGVMGEKETNRNGERILQIMERGGLEMGNKSGECVGKWT